MSDARLRRRRRRDPSRRRGGRGPLTVRARRHPLLRLRLRLGRVVFRRVLLRGTPVLPAQRRRGPRPRKGPRVFVFVFVLVSRSSRRRVLGGRPRRDGAARGRRGGGRTRGGGLLLLHGGPTKVRARVRVRVRRGSPRRRGGVARRMSPPRGGAAAALLRDAERRAGGGARVRAVRAPRREGRERRAPRGRAPRGGGRLRDRSRVRLRGGGCSRGGGGSRGGGFRGLGFLGLRLRLVRRLVPRNSRFRGSSRFLRRFLRHPHLLPPRPHLLPLLLLREPLPAPVRPPRSQNLVPGDLLRRRPILGPRAQAPPYERLRLLRHPHTRRPMRSAAFFFHTLPRRLRGRMALVPLRRRRFPAGEHVRAGSDFLVRRAHVRRLERWRPDQEGVQDDPDAPHVHLVRVAPAFTPRENLRRDVIRRAADGRLALVVAREATREAEVADLHPTAGGVQRVQLGVRPGTAAV